MECTTAAARGTEGSTESTSIRITGGVCLVVVVVVVVFTTGAIAATTATTATDKYDDADSGA